MEHIEFETKSDRELLILVAQKTNDIVNHLATLNESVAKHSTEIASIKAQMRGGCDDKPHRQILKDNWQLISGIVALLLGVLFALGKSCGWW